MNYIQKLQAQNKDKAEKLGFINEDINRYIAFLHSEKFTGFESNGGRKDWISTGDILHFLIELRGKLHL